MREIKREHFPSIYLAEGDSIQLTVKIEDPKAGNVHKTVHLFEDLGETIINTAVIFAAGDGLFGLDNPVGAVIGKERG